MNPCERRRGWVERRSGSGWGELQLQYVLPNTDWVFSDVFSWHFMLMRLNSPENKMKEIIFVADILDYAHRRYSSILFLLFLCLLKYTVPPQVDNGCKVNGWNEGKSAHQIVKVDSRRVGKRSVSFQRICSVRCCSMAYCFHFHRCHLRFVPNLKNEAKGSITSQLFAASEFHVFANALWIKSH